MTYLCVYHQSNSWQPARLLNHEAEIALELEALGVRLSKLPLTMAVDENTDAQQVLSAYQQQIKQLVPAADAVVEVLRAHTPQDSPVIQEFTQTGTEHRLFVAGRALLCFHAQEHVYALHCYKGDVVEIPANLARWFDAGEQPHFVVIRICANREAAYQHSTGSNIAEQYPMLADYFYNC